MLPLEEAGYQIVRLPTIRAALESLDQLRKADLILMDMILPLGILNPHLRADSQTTLVGIF